MAKKYIRLFLVSLYGIWSPLAGFVRKPYTRTALFCEISRLGVVAVNHVQR